MSRLLVDGDAIPVSPQLACAVGLNEAIVLQQIQYWIDHNRKQKTNFVDGQYWVFNSYPKWREQFPWWSEHTIQRILSGLEKRGLIVSGQYNKHKRDRTKWYRINYNKLHEIVPSCQNGVMDSANLARAIPETTQRLNDEDRKVRKGRFEKSPTPPSISPTPKTGTERKASSTHKRDSVFKAVTDAFGYGRASYMLSIVDWYIDEAYPYYTGKAHPEEGKAKRMTFAKKLLAASDETVSDDQLIVKALHRALRDYDDKCDPTIYYITTPKALGYWLIQDEDVGYESVNDTEYAPADAMY